MTQLLPRLDEALMPSYRFERELGGGGMSRVFVAEETGLGRRVVVKVLPPELGAGLNVVRFQREIRLAASLSHPNIVPLFTAGQADGLLYYTMPLIEGESLRAKLEREGELPIGESVRLLRDVVDALTYAHERGVVHRDIKPENVLVSRDHALVTDFGVAKALTAASGAQPLTVTGMILGTPAYMAPEQATADPHCDHRADIYAIGALAYEMLTARPPFAGPSPQAVLAAQVTKAPDPIAQARDSVPPALGAVIMRCLEKKPADRWQTANELLHQLDTVATSSRPSAGRRAALVAGLVLAILAVGAVGLFSRLSSVGAVRSAAERSASAPPASATETAPSIAVLPFVNLTSDAENEYFSDGMTEELIDALANVTGLQVAARTSSFAFKGQSSDVREIGQRLGVGTVLEGSVRRSGSKLRVTAQLIRTSNGYHLWSMSYDRELQDVFAVQDELARAIVTSLTPRLIRDSAMVRAPTLSPEAHDLYLKGRFFWNRETEAALRKAIDYFEQALAKDSSYALAYSGLADAYYIIAAHGFVPPKETFPKAKAAALEALALDSTLAEAHISLGYLARGWDWDPARAEQEFRAAIAHNPRYSTAYRLHAWLLLDAGDTAGAIREMKHALQLDPLSLVMNLQLGSMYGYARQHDSAVVQYRRTLDLDSASARTRRLLSIAYARLGRMNEALAELAKVSPDRDLEAADYPTISAYLTLYAIAGNRAEARRALRALQESATRRYVPADVLAQAHALVGDKESAFTWLERALRERDVGRQIQVTPAYESLHSDPRWTRVLQTMHLR